MLPAQPIFRFIQTQCANEAFTLFIQRSTVKLFALEEGWPNKRCWLETVEQSMQMHLQPMNNNFCVLYVFSVNDMKHTWWKFHSYPTSPSQCFTDKWKNTPNNLLFWQGKIFDTKLGPFFTIQKRFEHNWIKNSIAVRVYFWALFANLDFPNSLLAP